MYEIYCDDVCIYDDLNNQAEFRLISPELDLEDNTAGTLSFTMPVTNEGYNSLTRLKSLIKVFRNGSEIWRGRPLTENVDFYKNRKIVCEGELAFLNDTLQPQHMFENPSVRDFLSAILANHNAQVSADKRFTLGAVTVTEKMKNEESQPDEYFDDVIVYTNFDTTLSCITEKLINNLKGHIIVRWDNGVRYLDYLKEYPTTSSQVIRFGENLMDFVIDYDESEFCTVVIPLGERYEEGEVEGLEGYLDICDVNGGRNYLVNQQAYNTFGWIQRVAHFDNITDDEELLTKGQEFLTKNVFGSMVLEVSAMDLSYLDINYERFKLLDQVEVISDPHGLDKLFPLTKITLALDAPENSKYTLGLEDKSTSSLSSFSNEANKKVIETIAGLPSRKSILDDAKANAEAIMNLATKGYITITKGQNGTNELYISDTPDYTRASRYWRWNMNGLAYYQKGSGGSSDITIALTGSDGRLTANAITTGTMSADRVRTGMIVSTNGNTYFDLDYAELVAKDTYIENGRTVAYYAKLHAGGLDFSADDGTGRPMGKIYVGYWRSNYDNKGVVLASDVTNSKYLAFGFKNEAGTITEMSLLLNNGLNPNGDTQGVLFFSTVKFDSTINLFNRGRFVYGYWTKDDGTDNGYSMRVDDKYFSIGTDDENFIVFNNGLNPEGYSQDVLFWKTVAFTGTVNLFKRGRFTRGYWSKGDGTDNGYSMKVDDKYLTIGTDDKNFIIFNNGLNPSGYSQDVLFWRSAAFTAPTRFDNETVFTYDVHFSERCSLYQSYWAESHTGQNENGFSIVNGRGSSFISIEGADRKSKILFNFGLNPNGISRGIIIYDVVVYSSNIYASGNAGVSSLYEGTPDWHKGLRFNDARYQTKSDKRLKNHIENLEDDEEIENFVMKIKPVKYTFKDAKHNRPHFGFYAQDVRDVAEETVGDISVYFAEYYPDEEQKEAESYVDHPEISDDDEKLKWFMHYNELIPPLYTVVQKQQKRISELEERLAKLEGILERSLHDNT